MTLGNLTGVVAITWEFGPNGYTAMNLMGAWFKRRCIARGGDATRRRLGLVADVGKPAILNIAGRYSSDLTKRPHISALNISVTTASIEIVFVVIFFSKNTYF